STRERLSVSGFVERSVCYVPFHASRLVSLASWTLTTLSLASSSRSARCIEMRRSPIELVRPESSAPRLSSSCRSPACRACSPMSAHRGEPRAAWAPVLYVVVLGALSGAGASRQRSMRGHGPHGGCCSGTRPGARHGRDLLRVVVVAPDSSRARVFRAVVIGTLALVVPGLVAAALFSIIGPVMEIEDRSVLDTFGRSYRLARPNCWPVVMTSCWRCW